PGLSFSTSYTIPASGVASVTLPSSVSLGMTAEGTRTNGVVVTASANVAVYGESRDNSGFLYGTSTYLALPTSALTTDYRAVTYRNPPGGGGLIAITATADHTTVTILPTALVNGHQTLLPFTITLDRGQVYQLVNTAAGPSDLTGTRVAADKPVAVFAGN